ncbi:MAG: UPF0149 family protein [Aeromonadaceae bacterium]
MSSEVLSQYVSASDLLDVYEVMATPAEVHGVLTGLLCGGCGVQRDEWLVEFFELVNDGHAMPQGVTEWLQELFDATLSGLREQSGVELLLPEDGVSLEEQLVAVCDWAQAFLAGFAVMQQDLTKASEELQEMLGDISNITQLEVELEEDSENEASFYVLYEHLKLGVMMAFEEFGQHPQPERKPTLH